jgi:hypothetical protein
MAASEDRRVASAYGIAITADHIWIARSREKFIPIARVDWTQPALFGRSGNDAG